MYHPIFIEPKKLRDSDIESKILDLTKKYNLVMNMGKIDIGEQIVLIIDQLKAEQQERNRLKLQKVNQNSINGLIKTS